VHSSQQSVGNGLNDMAGLNGTVSYNLSQTDTLTASANYNSRSNDQRSATTTSTAPPACCRPATTCAAPCAQRRQQNFAWGSRYDHKGELPGETLKIDLRVSASENDNVNQYTNDYATPGMLDTRASQHNQFSTRIVDFTGDYERPLWGGTMKAGYKIATNDNSSNTLTDIDPVTGTATVNNGRTNAYEPDETVMRCTAATRCA
jgi:hypothetical protein